MLTRFGAAASSPALALALLTFAPPSLAQQPPPPMVSDADRAAARELFVEGVKLQEAGNFADALDRFQRAQSVFSAPTHLLHIAECEAALGRLVESAETYRTLVRTPLPPGAPNAFVQAQQQAAAELPQVEPRIPTIRLVVKPDRVARLNIQIDGQPMSAALVGVQRPSDPGTHTIAVYAPGYAKNEQQVTIREKENKDVAVTLQPAGGAVTYTPPPPVVVPPQQQTYPQSYPGQGQPPPPPPYVTYPEGQPPPPREREASGGFMLGATLGGLVPTGNLTQNNAINQYSSAGLAVGLAAGFRFAKRLYIGAAFEHGFLGSGSNLTGASSPGSSPSASTNYGGLDFAVISSPNGVAFFGQVGGGFRGATFDTGNGSTTYTGGEASIGAGVEIKVGEWVRLVPKVVASIGSFNSVSGGTVVNTDLHEYILFGMTTFVDFARKH